MSAIKGYRRHPASAVWPDLRDDEYAALRDNIDAQGQDAAILVTDDKIVVDGWHRLRACAELGIEPIVTVAPDHPDWIANKIIGAHAGRRHLSKIEIARLAIETKISCGLAFAGPGDRRLPSESAQNEQSPAITLDMIVETANVSRATARRAIAEAKEARLTEREKRWRESDRFIGFLAKHSLHDLRSDATSEADLARLDQAVARHALWIAETEAAA